MKPLEPPRPYRIYKAGQLILDEPGSPSKSNFSPDTKIWAALDTSHMLKAKPDSNSPASATISNTFNNGGLYQQHTMAEFAELVSKGCSIEPSKVDGKRRKESWVEQQVWAIDVDNAPADTTERGYKWLSHDDAIQRASLLGLPIFCSYRSFSSSDKLEKFRLLFCMRQPTRDKAKALAYAEALQAAYPECDPSSTELVRYFFATNKEVILWH